MKSSTEVASTETSKKDFMKVNCCRGSFHLGFHGSVHRTIRGSKFVFTEALKEAIMKALS